MVQNEGELAPCEVHVMVGTSMTCQSGPETTRMTEWFELDRDHTVRHDALGPSTELSVHDIHILLHPRVVEPNSNSKRTKLLF